MYEFFNAISQMFIQPLLNLAYSVEGLPILFAFCLGLVGAMAPCQFTGNIGAISLYGQKSLQKEIAWPDIIFFTLGKIVVFSALGLLVWVLGKEVESELTGYFPWFRRFIGPLFIIVGLFLLGFLQVKINLFSIGFPTVIRNKNIGSFLIGVSFSLGFCPTMFVLFFVTLMPVVIGSNYGVILPGIFALGTSMPLFIAIFLIWYYGVSGVVIKKGKRLGIIIHKTSGWIMVFIGLLDTITYWSL